MAEGRIAQNIHIQAISFISFVYITIEEAIQFFKGVVASIPTDAGRQHAKENLWVIEAYVKVTRAKNPLKPEEYQ